MLSVSGGADVVRPVAPHGDAYLKPIRAVEEREVYMLETV